MKNQHFRLATATATALLGAAGFVWWQFAAGASSGPRLADSNQPDTLQQLAGTAGRISPATGTTIGAESAGNSNAGGDAFLTPNLRQTFEEMLLEATGSQDINNPAQLKKSLAQLVPRYFSVEMAARAHAFVERFVDYRVALSTLKPPADPTDPGALRTALEARQRIRQQHFTSEEYETLFAQDEKLDQYTLARLEIERNSSLNEKQKIAALKDAELGLDETQRVQRNQAVAHLTVAVQTAVMDIRGTTETERFAQRSAQYGEAAATQLAQLDREDRHWQARLDEYANAQSQKTSPEQLQQLRQQLFSSQEQLRVEAALAARQSR